MYIRTTILTTSRRKIIRIRICRQGRLPRSLRRAATVLAGDSHLSSAEDGDDCPDGGLRTFPSSLHVGVHTVRTLLILIFFRLSVEVQACFG